MKKEEIFGTISHLLKIIMKGSMASTKKMNRYTPS